jgi:hypothetical protein
MGGSDLTRPNTLAFRGKRENQSKAGGIVNQVASVEFGSFCQNLVSSFMVKLEPVHKFPTSVISKWENPPPVVLLATSPSSLINPIIYQCHNYMDNDTYINLGDGGMSEE